MSRGPLVGLSELDRLAADARLEGYHLLPAARADLLSRAGRHDEARLWIERAVELAPAGAERGALERRRDELAAGDR